MQLLDLTLNTPEANLALDEALLLEAESLSQVNQEASGDFASAETLRFWESSRYFVVVGAGGRVAEEAKIEVCRRDGIPILRRASGGGTVLQGPGCLNYTLILDIRRRPKCQDIHGTNRYVLELMSEALRKLSPEIAIRGISDLAVGERKVSGTAQRRKKAYILFHGTLLYRFDLPLIERYLRLPRRQPEYRNNRPHSDFVCNLGGTSEELRRRIAEVWEATEIRQEIPVKLVEQLVDEKYSRDEWNEQF